MNIRILGAAIRIIPNRLQAKAIARALNFAFGEQSTHVREDSALNLVVKDIKQRWWFNIQGGVFTPASNASSNVLSTDGLLVTTSLDTVLKLRSKKAIEAAIDNNEITFEGEQSQSLIQLLKSVSDSRIEELTSRAYRFLKLKQPPRLNIHTVTLSEVNTDKDVDFLRDEAIRIESRDLELALRLMTIAHMARPEGPLIKRKLDEYHAKQSLD